MHISRHVVLLTILLLIGLSGPSPGAAQTGLHLTDEISVTVGSQPLSSDRRDLYVEGHRLALRGQTGWVIIDTRSGLVSMLDPQRRFISSFALDQADSRSKHGKQAPPLQPTGETKTVAGMPCQIFTAQQQTSTISACLARLPELEQFQTIFTTPPGTKGIPLDLSINGTTKKGSLTYTQRILHIEHAAVDPAVFTILQRAR